MFLFWFHLINICLLCFGLTAEAISVRKEPCDFALSQDVDRLPEPQPTLWDVGNLGVDANNRDTYGNDAGPDSTDYQGP